ncbi:MAG: hypothetical protein FRX49_02395 [Trebouxia sp. A1-2]|nr:MAG: hypothetical protein FRX49_02395 [Trebouxia sp. A1-2]
MPEENKPKYSCPEALIELPHELERPHPKSCANDAISVCWCRLGFYKVWSSCMLIDELINEHTGAPNLDEVKQHDDAVAPYADEGHAPAEPLFAARVLGSQLGATEGNPGSTLYSHLGVKASDTTRLSQLTKDHAPVLDGFCHKKVLKTSGQQVLETVVSDLRSMLPDLILAEAVDDPGATADKTIQPLYADTCDLGAPSQNGSRIPLRNLRTACIRDLSSPDIEVRGPEDTIPGRITHPKSFAAQPDDVVASLLPAAAATPSLGGCTLVPGIADAGTAELTELAEGSLHAMPGRASQGNSNVLPFCQAQYGYVLDQATKYPAIVRAGGGGDGAGACSSCLLIDELITKHAAALNLDEAEQHDDAVAAYADEGQAPADLILAEAVDDPGAIAKAEVVLTQKEHKLERLLTQKSMIGAALVYERHSGAPSTFLFVALKDLPKNFKGPAYTPARFGSLNYKQQPQDG